MIKFFKILPALFILLSKVSKAQILFCYKNNKLPISLRICGIFCTLIFYPKGLFVKPKQSLGKRVADCLYNLGSIYIKFGQTLSTRPDIVGVDVAKSLKYLQDKLPPFDSKIARNRITECFGKDVSDIFDYFNDKPIAAASIAQVHKALLKSGEEVAVKILRPDIAKKYEREIYLLGCIAQVIESTMLDFPVYIKYKSEM